MVHVLLKLGARQFEDISLRFGGNKEQTVYFAKEKQNRVGKDDQQTINSFLVSDKD